MAKLFQRHVGAIQMVFVIGIVGSALLLSASLEPDTRTSRAAVAPAATPVSVVRPMPERYSPTIRLNGVVEARAMTSVVPQVAGRVIEVSAGFRPGAEIAEGDLLFIIDPADFELAVDRTLAEIEAARSELALLEAEAAAEREVWESQFPDRAIPDLIARVPQIAAARARLHSAEAARAGAELSLRRTVIRSPFNARVLDTQLDIGQVVATGAAVGTIFAVDALEIKVPVSVSELQQIGSEEGRGVRVLTGGGNTLRGYVVRKSAALDGRTRLASLFIAPGDKASLTVGEFVSVEIEGEVAPAAYRLPASALFSQGALWVVDNDRLALRKVEVLDHIGDTAIVNRFDLADGVVSLPPANVRHGLPVTVESPARLAAGGGALSVTD